MAAIPDSSLPGHRHLHAQACTVLSLCQESRGVDFKESASWKRLQYKIAQAALGMANLRNGGLIIVGVGEREGRWQMDGISDEHLVTYDEDDVNDFVNRYASPPLRLELVVLRYEKARFLVVRVPEFDVTPVVCKRNGPDNTRLREGCFYVRPGGKPQTTRPVDASQIQDLLDLAAEKRARKLVEVIRRMGGVPPTEEQGFEEELGGL
jgi:predicted HTH transcriptional regulator